MDLIINNQTPVPSFKNPEVLELVAWEGLVVASR